MDPREEDERDTRGGLTDRDLLDIPPVGYTTKCGCVTDGQRIVDSCSTHEDSDRLERIEGMVTETRDIMHGIINAFGELQNHPMGKMLLKGMKLPEIKDRDQ